MMAWPGSIMFADVRKDIRFLILTMLTYNPSTMCGNSQEYPKNTVRGRVCLGLRLDWDLNSTKETSDIYVKPRSVASPFFKVEETLLGLTLKSGHLGLRLIVLALTIGWFSFMCYIINR